MSDCCNYAPRIGVTVTTGHGCTYVASWLCDRRQVPQRRDLETGTRLRIFRDNPQFGTFQHTGRLCYAAGSFCIAISHSTPTLNILSRLIAPTTLPRLTSSTLNIAGAGRPARRLSTHTRPNDLTTTRHARAQIDPTRHITTISQRNGLSFYKSTPTNLANLAFDHPELEFDSVGTLPTNQLVPCSLLPVNSLPDS